MPKPTLVQRRSFKTWLRKFRDKFANTTIPEFYIDAILSEKAVGISTTDDVRVIPFANYDTVDITTDEANDTLFYLPALAGDRVTVSFGSTSVALSMFGEDTGVTLQSSGITYVLNQNIPIARGRALTVKGLGGALLQSTSVPIYDVTPSATSVDEGQDISFTINTEGISAGTTLYYNTEQGASGTSAVGADLIAPNSGSFTIVSAGANLGVATVTRSITLDGTTEGPETFRFVVLTDSTTAGVVTRTDDITINDVIPTYSVGISTDNVNEGSSVEFTVNTSGIASGTTLYFSTSGTTVAADFTDNSLTGSFNIVGVGTTSAGIATFSRVLVAEGPGTEGTENFNITIRTGSTSGTAVTTTPTITVNDIFPSYDFVLTNQSGIVTDIADEGEVVTVTLNTTNIATGTEFRVWFDEEPGTNSDKNFRDFGYYNAQQNAFNSGNAEVITITGAATTFGIGARYDFRENENDTFRVILRERTAPSSGAALTFATLQVNDVHLLYDVTTDKTVVNEGDELTVTFGQPRHPVTGIGVPMPDGPVYVTLEPVSGTFPIVNNAPGDFSSGWGDLQGRVQTGFRAGYGNTSTFTIPIYADFLTEGLEVFYVAFRGHEYTHPIIARSADITINDTSTEPGSNANGLTFGPVIVNRDGGTAANATDWYKICKIDDLPEGSSIALFIDTSGSMTLQTVRASYDAFVAKLNEKNITITTVTNNNEDWITPFLVDLP